MNKLPKNYMIANSNNHLDIVEKTKILSTFPIFANATTAEVQQFAEMMYPRVIHPMEVFVEEDLDEEQAFFIYEGVVSIFRTTLSGEIINIDLLGAPELVGEMGLVDKKTSPASAMAIKESKALVLSQKDFEELISRNINVTKGLFKLFADRIRNFDVFLEHLLSNTLYDRTWKMLQYVSRFFPENEINLSQEQLADLLWGTRSRITEILSRLEKEGKIEISRKKVKVL